MWIGKERKWLIWEEFAEMTRLLSILECMEEGRVEKNKKETEKTQPSPCIHCGRCVSVCPLGLNPPAFSRAMELPPEEDELRAAILQREQVRVCMECGCCEYICSSKIPLVSKIKAGKKAVKEAK